MTDQQAIAEQPAVIRRSRRMDGIDAARALALIGMLAVHFGPQLGSGPGGFLLWFPHGRASILFAVVAGIGMAFLTADPQRRLRGRLRLLCYGLVLLPAGLILEPLDHPVAVILHHYAAFFALGACVAGLKGRTLLTLALAMTLIGPAIFFAGRLSLPELFDRSTVSIHDDPVTILTGLLFSGPYPLITWSAALLFGFWLGRGNLRARRTALWLVVGGVAVAVAAILLSFALFDILGRPTSKGDWRFLFTVAAHSQMPLWLIQATALAAAAVGLSLVAARWLPLATAGFAALGRLTLTVYVAHILAMIIWPDVLIHEDVASGLWSTGLFTALAMLIAVLWQPLGRGPIERLMHGFWEWVEDLLPERHEQAGAAAERPTRHEHLRPAS
ncbi:heparan-alpha-glucosaminide N-acetyltransferase domain-containing protein [Devosia nitrariae]|uniref:Transporter n=1 Tax=Devosia nitrariae TaxID=2071872 RepID=A0ABQ5W1U8_9HYPH|nr:heparan-alpha-glucosaminide N-acetyltransferase domain-containing protein [Devosia nitrariae]GLQ53789.1 transporter [Devosia nitrariae]